ncbi:hypothetical protein yaldo0001_37120 [Yersinia aldovae ATCC 35236]|nr:hypothetical protein yaldo0001_37120 [Yersinia aldovae ATCC 35236]
MRKAHPDEPQVCFLSRASRVTLNRKHPSRLNAAKVQNEGEKQKPDTPKRSVKNEASKG